MVFQNNTASSIQNEIVCDLFGTRYTCKLLTQTFPFVIKPVDVRFNCSFSTKSGKFLGGKSVQSHPSYGTEINTVYNVSDFWPKSVICNLQFLLSGGEGVGNALLLNEWSHSPSPQLPPPPPPMNRNSCIFMPVCHTLVSTINFKGGETFIRPWTYNEWRKVVYMDAMMVSTLQGDKNLGIPIVC